MRGILINKRQNFLCQQLDRYSPLDSLITQLMFSLLGKTLQTTERKQGEKNKSSDTNITFDSLTS